MKYVVNWIPLDTHVRIENIQPCLKGGQPLRWGWVFLERTRNLSGIQFTTHFIDCFVVQT